jgi:hypothetical protein
VPVAYRQARKVDHYSAGNIEHTARIVPADREGVRPGTDNVDVLVDEHFSGPIRDRAGNGESDDVTVIGISDGGPERTGPAIRQRRDNHRCGLAPQR